MGIDLWTGGAELVSIGAGPPGKGALRDERSSHVQRTSAMVEAHVPWAQTHTLMESVASMRASEIPGFCEAGSLTWCNRQRLYWLTWDIHEHSTDVLIHGRTLSLSGTSPIGAIGRSGMDKGGSEPGFPDIHHFTANGKPRTSTSRTSFLR